MGDSISQVVRTDRFYTVGDLRLLLQQADINVSRQTIYNWQNTGIRTENGRVRLHMDRRGGRWFVHGNSVLEFFRAVRYASL